MIKKILLIITIIVLFSCKEKHKKAAAIKNYVTLSGRILNKNSDVISIANNKIKFKKTIKVSEEGYFKDSFDIANSSFLKLTDGTEYCLLYLKNGDEVSMNVDAKLFKQSIKFSGKGYEKTKFLNKKLLLRDELIKDDAIYHLSEEKFKTTIQEFKTTFLKELQQIKNQNGTFALGQKKELEKFQDATERSFKGKNNIRMKLKKGTPTPEFTEPYESTTGKKYSLKDFKGKYVYLEFWTTWCKNCKRQHQYTKKLVEQFKGKNIQFVGISTDSETEYYTWKEDCEKYNLPGIQLFYDGDSQFTKKYLISEIPRFILLDPQGNIIDAYAPIASDPNLIKVLNDLGL